MKRVLVVHPQLITIGGAELVAIHVLLWFLSKKDIEVTLMTLKPVDFKHIEKLTGLNIPSNMFDIKLAYCPAFVRDSKGRFELLKLAFLHRAARKYSHLFDLCMSTYNEMDFGTRGAQYIHHPIFAKREYLHKFDMIATFNFLDRYPFLNYFYRKFIFFVSGESAEKFKENITLVNSEFTKDIVRDVYNINGTVIYPALAQNARMEAVVPW